jgi:adenylate kinase
MARIQQLVLLLGIPGAGKTTLGNLLRDRCDVLFLGAGVLLRSEEHRDTSRSRIIRAASEQAEGVPVEISYGLLKEAIADIGHASCVVLDGYPRTVDEVSLLSLTAGRDPDAVIVLQVPTVIAVGRLLTRAACVQCGRPFGPHGPPPTRGRCDACGGTIVTRVDDSADGITKRHRFWTLYGEELVRHYAAARIDIDGTRSPDEVLAEVSELLRLPNVR